MDISKDIQNKINERKQNIYRNIIVNDDEDVIKKAISNKGEEEKAAKIATARRYEGIPAKDRPKIRKGVKSSKKGQDKVALVMEEFKNKTLKDRAGRIVTDKDQALTIAMSEAGLSYNE